MAVRTRWRGWAAVVAAGALVLAACGGDDGDDEAAGAGGAVDAEAATDTTVAAEAGGDDVEAADGAAADGATVGAEPAEFTVLVDNADGTFPASYNEFYPAELSVRPGDSLVFEMPTWQGEPHNVAVGQVVTGAVDAYAALPSDTLVFPGGPLPEVTEEQAAAAALLPPSLPPNLEPTEVAMEKLAPCWLDEETPPLDAPCPPEAQDVDRVFTGTEQYVASEVMIESGDRFRLDLADDVAPGTYGFICTLHPSSMFGTFEVVEPGTEIAAPAEVRAQGESDLSEVHAAMAEAAQRLSAQTGTFVQAGEVAGGAVPPYSINVFPSQVSVPAGETVTWEVHGAHMFTFNPPEDEPLFVTLERGDDGIVRPTANDYEAPGPGQPGMPAEFTLDPVSIDGGEFDGASYLHSGLLWGRIGPLPPMEYSLTFTEPGTYTYYCLRHPGMVGTVEVTG